MTPFPSAGFLLPALPDRTRPGARYVRPRTPPGDEIVIIKIGPMRTSKTWVVKKELLCSRSPYFKNIFAGKAHLSANARKTHRLRGDDQVAFAKIYNWLTTGTLSCSFCAAEPEKLEDQKETKTLHELSWCKLWISAKKYEMLDLCELIIRNFQTCLQDRMRLHPELYISKETVKFVRRNAPSDSKLWVLMTMEVANYAMSTIGNQCFFARLAEYHGGDRRLEKDFMTAVDRHINHSHCCGLGHWRVPMGCHYVDHDVSYQGREATSWTEAGFKYA